MKDIIMSLIGIVISGYMFNIMLYFFLEKHHKYDVPDEFIPPFICGFSMKTRKIKRKIWFCFFFVPFLPLIYILLLFCISLGSLIILSPILAMKGIIKELIK